MNIKPTVYDSLTPRQRVIATLEAEARGDGAEVNRLRESCPFKAYRQRDPAWSDTIEILRLVALAVEYDLALEGLLWERYDDPLFLENMAAIDHGWTMALADYGIAADTLRKAFDIRSPEVEPLLLASNEVGAPAHKLDSYTAKMRELLQGRLGTAFFSSVTPA